MKVINAFKGEGTYFDGLVMDVSKDAAKKGFPYKTVISSGVLRWISRPDDPSPRLADERFDTLLRCGLDGTVRTAAERGETFAVGRSLIWIEPGRYVEVTSFIFVCVIEEDSLPLITILLCEELKRMDETLH
jgi:hypothetical protein